MQMPGTLTLLDGEHTLEKLTTSTKSVADYFKDRLRAKGSGSSSPLLSTGSEKDAESSEAPRGGLGSSRLGLGARVDGQTPTVGLGASKFGSLVSGAFLASLPTVSAVEKLDDAASNEGGEKKSDKREQDETGNKSNEWPEPSGSDERLYRKEMMNKRRKKDEQKPASTNEVATKMSDKEARRKEKAERKAAKKATSAAA
jgi:Pin2-interacting protein X1